MRLGKFKWMGMLAAALLAAPSFAQDIVDDDEIFEEDDDIGFDDTGLTVRGGVSNFTGDLGDDTTTGAFLGIQADARPINGIGVELGYEGSRNALSDADGAIWRHNVGALAKVGPIINEFRPFVGAGFGVSVLDPSNDAATLGYDNDVITEVPLAAGLEYKLGDLTAGARATYRILGDEEVSPVPGDTGNLFNVGLTLGGRF